MEYDKRIQMRYLLDLYFEGETTLEQERQLREYFTGDDVPADLEYARAMFGLFTAAAVHSMPRQVDICGSAEGSAGDGASEVIHAGTEGDAPATGCQPGENVASGEPLKTQGVDSREAASSHAGRAGSASRSRRKRVLWLYAAASVAAVALVTMTVVRQTRPTVYCYVDGQPVTDLELATRQMEMAVRILDGNLKASANSLATAGAVSGHIRELDRILTTGNAGQDDGKLQ